MPTLIVIGVLAGIVTGLSPCVLPVLPAVLATSAVAPGDGADVRPDPRRPYLVVAGLVSSFVVFTLTGGALLSLLHLPDDLLRTLGIVAILIVGIGLLIPAVGHLLERPFARFSRVGARHSSSAFLFGVTFGLVFVPCAGPVLAAITVLAATHTIGPELIVLTLAFGIGVALPLLAIAIAGQQMAARIRSLRERMPLLRRIAGGVLVVTAVAVWFGATDPLQRLVPGYVEAVQSSIEDSDSARAALDGLTRVDPVAGASSSPRADSAEPLGSELTFDECAEDSSVLANCGSAIPLVGVTEWLNTDGGAALTLDDLSGRVVLVDFWTYSCINCQRTLPYLTAWDAEYRDKGLTIIGVHTPEFAFEHDVDNVRDEAAALGVRYPVAIDNDYFVWQTYNQRYWPAHYLIDKDGVVRQVHYGEGAYDDTERLIRELLDEPATPATPAQSPVPVAATTVPADQLTPETYLGFEQGVSYANELDIGVQHHYDAPDALGPGMVGLSGSWKVNYERIRARKDPVLQLRYSANHVYLVLGGEGTVTVTAPSGATHVVTVTGAPTLYELTDEPAVDGLLTLAFTPGLDAYAFTFG